MVFGYAVFTNNFDIARYVNWELIKKNRQTKKQNEK
jgi:hypothetical protein